MSATTKQYTKTKAPTLSPNSLLPQQQQRVLPIILSTSAPQSGPSQVLPVFLPPNSSNNPTSLQVGFPHTQRYVPAQLGVENQLLRRHEQQQRKERSQVGTSYPHPQLATFDREPPTQQLELDGYAPVAENSNYIQPKSMPILGGSPTSVFTTQTQQAYAQMPRSYQEGGFAQTSSTLKKYLPPQYDSRSYNSFEYSDLDTDQAPIHALQPPRPNFSRTRSYSQPPPVEDIQPSPPQPTRHRHHRNHEEAQEQHNYMLSKSRSRARSRARSQAPDDSVISFDEEEDETTTTHSPQSTRSRRSHHDRARSISPPPESPPPCERHPHHHRHRHVHTTSTLKPMAIPNTRRHSVSFSKPPPPAASYSDTDSYYSSSPEREEIARARRGSQEKQMHSHAMYPDNPFPERGYADSNYGSRSPVKSRRDPTNPHNKRNTILGSLGGAAIGNALFPGIGTALGPAITGGLMGGIGGHEVDNHTAPTKKGERERQKDKEKERDRHRGSDKEMRRFQKHRKEIENERRRAEEEGWRQGMKEAKKEAMLEVEKREKRRRRLSGGIAGGVGGGGGGA